MTASSIILRHEKPLRKLALYLTRDEDDAKDLFQDTCVRIVRHIHKFDGANELTWAKMILRNCFKDDYRRKRRVPEHLGYEAIRDNYPDQVSDSLLSDELTEALNILCPQQRVLFAMVHVENYTYDELSAISGYPVGTVKTKVRAAKYLMRESLIKQGARVV